MASRYSITTVYGSSVLSSRYRQKHGGIYFLKDLKETLNINYILYRDIEIIEN